ncbi:hypothetical protein V8G54_037755, partial [Vigna mungo]
SSPKAPSSPLHRPVHCRGLWRRRVHCRSWGTYSSRALLEADSLTEFWIPTIAAIYRWKPLLVARWLRQTGFAFEKWFGMRYIDTLSEYSETMFQVGAAELRKILVELGPTYIKIAQAISSQLFSKIAPESIAARWAWFGGMENGT